MSDTPRPGSWIKKPAPKAKRPFILKDHLSNRPLLHEPRLEALLHNLKGTNK